MGAEGSLLTLGNALAASWLPRLVHGSLSGGLFIAGVWAVCRLVPRMPANARGWLWWLACLKMVVDLAGVAPVALPLLPAAPAPSSPLAAHPAAALAPVGVVPPTVPVGMKAALPGEATASPTDAPAARPLWPTCLGALWLCGVLAWLVVTAWQGSRVRGLVRAAQPVSLPNVDADALAHALGLRRAPRLLESPSVASPCVAGLFRPTILLPPGLADTLTPDELRLALAHEMAHVRRGDLVLALLPALARALFFFHPLVWLACAEWSMAREEACDALALRATGAPPASFGSLLLRLAGGPPRAPALGLSPGYHGLRRRLLGLSRTPTRALPGRWLLAVALAALLPWRLTAANRAHSLTPTSDSALPRYAITDLGDATNGDSEATALNEGGQVVGTVHGADEEAQALAWTGRDAVALGALPKHHFTLASGINGAGGIVGTSYNIPGHGRAFFWDGSPHRLGSLPGYPYSEARGVNDAGQVAGTATLGATDRWQAQVARAFLWQSGKMTDLGTLGGPYSTAYGLNDTGMVVGKADTDTFGQTHAFLWQTGQMTDLGTLGGMNSLAYRVSDSGTVAGSSETGAGDTRHAFLWQGGQMRDLGTLPGTSDSVAYDVNAAGDAVGSSAPALDSPGKRAFLWHDGRLLDLNTLLPPGSGWTLTEARAVNDKGQIAGVGTFGGHVRAFLLTPR